MTRVPIRLKKQMKVKTPESGVLRACLDLLAAEKIWHCRMNTGAVKSGKRFFRFGKPGMADILASSIGYGRRGISNGCGPIAYWPDGRAVRCPKLLWIECKSESGKQSSAQEEFQKEVIAAGHHYVLVRDVDALKNWLKEHGAYHGYSGPCPKPPLTKPAPAQPVSAEAFWSEFWKDKEEYIPNVRFAFAEAFAAQQNAALREELARAKKGLADSRLNHVDANQRNMQAIARAEAAEAELANIKQQLEIAKAGLAALAAAFRRGSK